MLNRDVGDDATPDGGAPGVPGSPRIAPEDAESRARERARRDAADIAAQAAAAKAAREAAARREAGSWDRIGERLARHAEVTERLGSATPDPPRWAETCGECGAEEAVEGVAAMARELADWYRSAAERSEAVREHLELSPPTAAETETARERVLASAGDPRGVEVVPADLAILTPAPAAESAEPELPRHGPTDADRLAVLDLRLRHCRDFDVALREIRHAAATGVPLGDLIARCDRAEQLYRVHYLDNLRALSDMLRTATAGVMRARELAEFAVAIESGDYPKILRGPKP